MVTHIPSLGMQTPTYAAPNMLCIHRTMINAQYISVTCTIDTHSAVYCATRYANTMQRDVTHIIRTMTYYCATNQLLCNVQLPL